MKQQAGAPRSREQRSEVEASPNHTLQPTSVLELSDEARAILDCLRTAGTGLTVGQLSARVTYDLATMEAALGVLMERGLVTRLNTIIPSYSFYHSASRFHAG